MSENTNLPEPKRNNDYISGTMVLPTIDTFTDQKIETAVNEVYRGYTKANPDSMKSLDQVVQYVRGREAAHSKMLSAGLTTAIKIRAAVNACRWDLGNVIDRSMQNPEFGSKVVPTLAKELGLDESDIVGLQQLNKNVTRVEAYVMGLYGVSTSKLLQIASIPDKNSRDKLVELCCSHGLDLADSAAVSRHVSKIQNALKVALLPQAPAVESSEEEEDEEDVEQEEATFDVVPDSVHKAVKTLETLEGMLKPFRSSKLSTDEDNLAAVNPDSLDTGKEVIKQMVDIIKEKAVFLAKDLNEVEDMIRAYREAVDSLIASFATEVSGDVENDSGDPEEE